MNGRAPSREALQPPPRRPGGGPPTRAARLAVAAVLAVLLYIDFYPYGGDELVVVVPSEAAPSPAPTAPPTPAG